MFAVVDDPTEVCARCTGAGRFIVVSFRRFFQNSKHESVLLQQIRDCSPRALYVRSVLDFVCTRSTNGVFLYARDHEIL